MRMPFEKLVERVDAMSDEEKKQTMGTLSERWGRTRPENRGCCDCLPHVAGRADLHLDLGG